ncbi:SusC/RagA family TonB-linked outer membrane protein [Sphingobacterium corticibacterium]|nr:SusC/RagA family TonB-linked outer membrane protein [Sphingobacterium corticibacterium]
MIKIRNKIKSRDGYGLCLLLYIVCFSSLPILSYSQKQIVTGIVKSEGTREPIPNVSVELRESQLRSITDDRGIFIINSPVESGDLKLSHVGYEQTTVKFDSVKDTLFVIMKSIENLIDNVEIVSTGYYDIPKERATGSFSFLTNEDLNRFPATNILDRIDGMVNALTMDRSHLNGERTVEPKLRLRGLSTIESDSEPLIILDGFPYEEGLSSINPSDIENITILKDAAAASIWGARAGNGVLVISTKKGKFNQRTQLTHSTVFQFQSKPDLFYDPNYLPSSAVLDIEEEMFARNNYRERNQTPIPLYTEWLIKNREGAIDDTELSKIRYQFEHTDTRAESLKHFYRTGLNRHHDVALSGGGAGYSFRSGASYDSNRSFMKGNMYTRWNANMQGTVKWSDRWSITPAIWYTQQKQQESRVRYSSFTDGGISVVPYYRFMDEQGNALPVVNGLRYAYQESALDAGLLDWMYRPVDELGLTNSYNTEAELRLQLGTAFHITNTLRWNTFYQFLSVETGGSVLYNKDSYHVRNMVNRFTQGDLAQIIPYGDMRIENGRGKNRSHNIRTQVDGNNTWGDDHHLAYLVGAELMDRSTNSSPAIHIYDYDPELLLGRTNFDYTKRYTTRPTGSSLIAQGSGNFSQKNYRFLSYYSNASYDYKEKYLLSGSVRWDASNIYGVKTNQKGVPLWSLGAAWHLGKETFFKTDDINQLKLRMTYGSSGNTNPNVSTYPIISYDINGITNLQYASLRSVGNPSLRWEKVNTFNLGMDIAVFNNRVSGSLEYYRKKSEDLIGVTLMDPTTGIIEDALPAIVNRVNYANLKTEGWDITLNSQNVKGVFNWNSRLQFALVKNEVTNYETNEMTTTLLFLSQPTPVLGRSLDAIFAYPWNGLNSEGKPIIYRNGEISSDYIDYYNTYAIPDLVYVGDRVPPLTTNLMNTFQWRKFQLSVNLSWKSGYYFQRSTMSNMGEINGNYHRDYFNRWTKPGDEQWTDVLPRAEVSDQEVSAISTMHANSEALWEKGDHLRIRDAVLGYSFDSLHKWARRINTSFSVSNIGILWRKNKYRLDPDFPNATYPPPRIFALSINVDF